MYKTLIVALIALLCVGCSTDNDKRREELESHRSWQRTDKGIRYFYQCIDGYRFIATRSTHDYIQLAGPVGGCDT